MTATAQALYVVEVQDRCLAQLAGHNGCSYASPPQSEQQALTLVRVLLGCPHRPLTLAAAPWQAAIPGGQRHIRIHPALPDGQLHL